MNIADWSWVQRLLLTVLKGLADLACRHPEILMQLNDEVRWHEVIPPQKKMSLKWWCCFLAKNTTTLDSICLHEMVLNVFSHRCSTTSKHMHPSGKKHPLTVGSLQQDGRFEKQFVPCWNEWMTAGFINITRKQNLEVIFVAEIKTTNQQCFIGWADFFKLQVSIGSTGNPKQESWLVTLRRLGNRSIQQKSHGERSNKKNTPGSTNSDSWLGNPPHPWMSIDVSPYEKMGGFSSQQHVRKYQRVSHLGVSKESKRWQQKWISSAVFGWKSRDFCQTSSCVFSHSSEATFFLGGASESFVFFGGDCFF